MKVNPLARWTQADVDDYVGRHNILVNPLLSDGFASVGCFPCTRRTSGRRPAGRPVGRQRQDRVRHPPGGGTAVSAPTYPLTLDVAGRRAVVVGGGPVAARRASGLVDAGADVVVVAPYVCEDLRDLLDSGALTWQARDYTAGDLDGAWLVHTATGDPATDDLVAAHAEGARVWCVRADDASRSAAWTPAVARSGSVTVAVTAGGDPRRARSLREAIAVALDAGELPLRHHRRAAAGHVALVGGGPGDPGLITTRGRRLLAEADVVVVDRLAPRALLDGLDEDVLVDRRRQDRRQPPGAAGADQPAAHRARPGRPPGGAAQGR